MSRSPMTVPLITASPQRTLPSMCPFAESTSRVGAPESAARPMTSPRTRPSMRMPLAKARSPVISTPSAISVESAAILMNGRFFELGNMTGSPSDGLSPALAGLAEKRELLLRFGELLVQGVDLVLELGAPRLREAQRQATLLELVAQRAHFGRRRGRRQGRAFAPQV